MVANDRLGHCDISPLAKARGFTYPIAQRVRAVNGHDMRTARAHDIGSLYHAATLPSRALRARITRRRSSGLRVLALGTVATGLLLVIEQHLGVGLAVLLTSAGVTWLAGLWVAPWGIDAYSRKLSRIMREWRASVPYEGDGESDGRWRQVEADDDSLIRCVSRMQRLRPPPSWAVDHHKHLEAAKAYCVALRAYRATTRDGDAETRGVAAQKLAEASIVLNALTGELSRKVREGWTDPRKLPSHSSNRHADSSGMSKYE
jgi:hypothetical protein